MRSLLLLLVLTFPAWGLTVDELVAKNLEARGGREKIRALKSLRLTGSLVSGNGDSTREIAYQSEILQGKVRQEFTLQGLTALYAYDGKEAWKLSPFGGRREPERLSEDESKGLIIDSDLEGQLLDYQAKGSKVEYLGTEDVDGTLAHKLRLTRRNGDVDRIYLDPDHFLEIRIVRSTTVRGTMEEEEIDLGNYERVAGVYVPFSVDSGRPGGAKNSRLTIQKAEANVALEDGRFRFPGSKP